MPENTKTNILEQAMHEVRRSLGHFGPRVQVFPSDIDFTDSQEETVTTAQVPPVHHLGFYLTFSPDNSHLLKLSFKETNLQVGDDLYNPMRSPLKNRTKILCEVLGI